MEETEQFHQPMTSGYQTQSGHYHIKNPFK